GSETGTGAACWGLYSGTGAGGWFWNGAASGTGPAQARISCCGAAGAIRSVAVISVKGAGGTGRAIELVVSADGCSMRLSIPELEVQPTRAVQPSAIAVTTEKRMI